MRHFHGRCFCAPKARRPRKIHARDPWRGAVIPPLEHRAQAAREMGL